MEIPTQGEPPAPGETHHRSHRGSRDPAGSADSQGAPGSIVGSRSRDDEPNRPRPLQNPRRLRSVPVDPSGHYQVIDVWLRLDALRPKGYNAFLLDGAFWYVSTKWESTEKVDEYTIACMNTNTGSLERIHQSVHVRPVDLAGVTLNANAFTNDELRESLDGRCLKLFHLITALRGEE